MIAGASSAVSTERFRQRSTRCDPGHFRRLQDAWVSSIGFGTYLGDADEETDGRYAAALGAALGRGCNLIDTAISYRCQRSERAIGAVLASLAAERPSAREELVICTKGGYVPFDGSVPRDPARYLADTIVRRGLAPPEAIVAGCHCLHPGYLAYALDASRANLRIDTIDVYYLHNPEEQLEAVDRTVFLDRMEQAFALLESRASQGLLRYYGVATWHGLRAHPDAPGHLSLAALVGLAERVGAAGHHFRVIQLPYNLAMPEAYVFKNQRVGEELLSPLEAARRLGISVVASASLLQRRLTRLPKALETRIPGRLSAAQRALQFVRSTPGVTAALVGTQTMAHVEENLALASQPLLPTDVLNRLFERKARSPHGS